MAVQLETQEGIGEDESLNTWLKQHKLTKSKQKLKENDVTLDELRELASGFDIEQLKSYAMESLGLNIIESQRFAKGVMSLKSNKKAATQRPIRVLITNEEQDALTNITKKKQVIKSKINESLININRLKQISSSNADKLNKIRKNIIYHINQRIDHLIVESDKIINKKKEIFGDNIKKLQDMDKSLNVTETKCNQYLDDTDMDINKRKIKIINLTKHTLNVEIEDIDITPTVSIKLDQNKIIDIINNMGYINDPDLPSTPDLYIADIEESSAKVEIKNRKREWECLLEINRGCKENDTDDEKNNDNKWQHLCSIKNADNYSITLLKSGTIYGLRGKYKDSKQQYGKWCKSVSFKTKPLQKDCFHVNNERTFDYKSDQHGNIYHVFGMKRIERQFNSKYQWIVETRKYGGYLGIIDDTDNVSNTITDKTSDLFNHRDVVQAATKHGNYTGHRFGSTYSNLSKFITNDDVITMTLDYTKNTICFESKGNNKKVKVDLRDGVEAIRLFAEFTYDNSSIKII